MNATLGDQLRLARRRLVVSLIGSLLVGIVAVAISLLLLVSSVLAQSQFKAGQYVIEGLQFGQEITAFSKEESIKPVISAEGPILKSLTDSSVDVEWTTDKSSSSVVFFRKDEAGTTNEEQGKSTELLKVHKVKLVGLEPNTTYRYKVQSKDRVGNIGESAEASFTTKKSAGIIAPTFSDITLTSFILTFQTTAVVNSRVYYGTAIDNLDQYIDEDSANGSFTTNHVIRFPSLTEGTTYYLKIVATDSFGKKLGSDVYTVSTLPKPSVLSISIVPKNPNEVTVRWTTNTETDSLIEYWTPSSLRIEGFEGGERQSEGSTGRIKDHEVKLRALAGNTTYQARILATDKFGNQTESSSFVFKTPRDNSPPKIEKLKVDPDVLSSRGGSAVSALVSWATDEPSTSQIRYGQGSLTTETPEDELLTQSHLVILEGLSPASSYKLQARSQDPAGNVGESPTTTFLTQPKRRSLFQLLAQKLEENFGWLRNLGLLQ